jgi:putative membrane protein
MGSTPVNLHTLLTDWAGGPFAIGAAVVVVLVAVWYLRAAHQLRARGRDWSWSRTASFLGGLVCVELALGSSVASLAQSRFTAHVAQHLLLMIAAPPLGALGAPLTLLLQTARRPLKTFVLSVLHSRVFAVVSHPIVVFFLYYISMFAFFLTGAIGYAMEHMWLMDLINLGFLGGATLFWWPMVGLDPIPRWQLSPGFKLINLLVGIPFESFLGIALLMQSSPAAPMYTLSSTHTGGGVLWAFSEVATMVAVLPVFGQWTRADARLAKRIDARLDAGLSIQPPPMEGHGLAATMKVLRRG